MPDEKKEQQQETSQGKTLTQEQVDAIVQDRLSRERAKFADYDELKKFRTEHERQLEAASQKELESKKEYDKLKEGWTRKESEFQGLLSKKDAEIVDMKLSSALVNEITKQNAYAEETMAILKNQAVIDKEGNIRIKGRDANGFEVMDSIEEGTRKFLATRPYLVKATNRAGAGTGSSTAAANTGAQDSDLMALNVEYAAARARGDYKKANELSTKMRAQVKV